MRAPAPFEAKICPPAQLASRLATLPRAHVFTNGVFDILHRGHASYLAQARALGNTLLVAVNSDASVRQLGKGPERPINGLADRMALLAALESVSLVTWFDETTPLRLIEMTRPDVLVKGGDWPLDRIIGSEQVRSWGGASSRHTVRSPALYKLNCGKNTGAQRSIIEGSLRQSDVGTLSRA